MSFHEIFGQANAVGQLTQSLNAGRAPHAYLFAGPGGVGKRATARAWARVLLCASPVGPSEACGLCAACRKVTAGGHPDLLWVDFDFQARFLEEEPAKQRSLKIATVREMERLLRLKPMEAARKVAVLDPAEKLVEEAAHALLKILEEPPPHTHLALLCEDPSQILGTLRSRCQTVRFGTLPAPDVAAWLVKTAGLPPEDAQDVARRSEGSLAKARSLAAAGEDDGLDWESASLSELMAFCETFQRSKDGRAAAENFLRRLLAQFQDGARAGRRTPADLQAALDALHQLKQNVSPQLTVEVLLLNLRWAKRGKKETVDGAKSA